MDIEQNSEATSDDSGNPPPLPEWCNIYEGLSEAEIEELERAIIRCDLKR
jgi:hypothetical protein